MSRRRRLQPYRHLHTTLSDDLKGTESATYASVTSSNDHMHNFQLIKNEAQIVKGKQESMGIAMI